MTDYRISKRDIERLNARTRRKNIVYAWILFIGFGGLLIAAAYVGGR